MSDSRVPGRYRLDRLGWTAFEDLCMQILRVVLGETCTRFGQGQDAGRDGYYRGEASGKLAKQDRLAGAFVVQCKHTSRSEASLQPSDLEPEATKLAKLAAQESCHYLLMTNRRVSAPAEAKIRGTFEAIPGVGRVLVLAESWIEDTIDAEPRLLRLVPRLYGIGDLSQIVSFTLEQQTRALFEELAHSLRTYVPTESYRQAERALAEHGFVVLVGPPAAGKSAIAANLCLVSMAQSSELRVLRIENADEFKSTWSPADRNTLYWVDDVFGETTLDEERLKDWSAALDRVDAARKRGARIVFCTRNYILEAALRKLKAGKAHLLADARVRVDVTDLSQAEKDAILYNHIKEGDLTRAQKKLLKGHLPGLARLVSFTPELARRLGSARFHHGLSYSETSLQGFFNRPLRHLRDLMSGLSDPEAAALVVCFLAGNAVADPVRDEAISCLVLGAYDASRSQIRSAFETLEGSLVKRSHQPTRRIWQFHHPSMIEAMQQELAEQPSRIEIYVEGAKLNTLLSSTTTLDPLEDGRLVFVPDTVYPQLLNRLRRVKSHQLEPLAAYLVDRGSASFLVAFDATSPKFLDWALSQIPEPESTEVAPRLAVRLADAGLFSKSREEIVFQSLRGSLEKFGWLGFFEVKGFSSHFPDVVEKLLRAVVASRFSCVETLKEWLKQDLSSDSHLETAVSCMAAQQKHLVMGLASAGLGGSLVETAEAMTQDCIEEFCAMFGQLDDDERWDDWDYERRERWEPQETLNRFTDVDE